MAMEIERKFLVKNEMWREGIVSDSVLKQGYLSSQPSATVRVRIDGQQAFLTIKSKTIGISRAEFEYPIPLADADDMLQGIAQKPLIDKIRYKVRCGKHVWDLDIFKGENLGLIVAEVELNHEDEAFLLPPWVGEEVSGDSRYFNSNLAKMPYSRW